MGAREGASSRQENSGREVSCEAVAATSQLQAGWQILSETPQVILLSWATQGEWPSADYGNEKKLQRHNQLQPFRDEMDSYFKLDHAEVVPKEELLKPHYYMPVHGVVKDSSTTTRMRPVFDASATTTTGNSFNNQLLPSPSLYPFVSDLLLQFWLHPIAMSADIGKMFRQIHLAEEECGSWSGTAKAPLLTAG